MRCWWWERSKAEAATKETPGEEAGRLCFGEVQGLATDQFFEFGPKLLGKGFEFDSGQDGDLGGLDSGLP